MYTAADYILYAHGTYKNQTRIGMRQVNAHNSPFVAETVHANYPSFPIVYSLTCCLYLKLIFPETKLIMPMILKTPVL